MRRTKKPEPKRIGLSGVIESVDGNTVTIRCEGLVVRLIEPSGFCGDAMTRYQFPLGGRCELWRSSRDDDDLVLFHFGEKVWLNIDIRAESGSRSMFFPRATTGGDDPIAKEPTCTVHCEGLE